MAYHNTVSWNPWPSPFPLIECFQISFSEWNAWRSKRLFGQLNLRSDQKPPVHKCNSLYTQLFPISTVLSVACSTSVPVYGTDTVCTVCGKTDRQLKLRFKVGSTHIVYTPIHLSTPSRSHSGSWYTQLSCPSWQSVTSHTNCSPFLSSFIMLSSEQYYYEGLELRVLLRYTAKISGELVSTCM